MSTRMKAAERRASILAVAKILFADCGYHGVSVDEIAKRLGVSPAVLYRHFDSKEALYSAVLNEFGCRRESYVEAALAGTDEFPAVLRRMARVYVDSVIRDPDYLKMEMQAMLEDPALARQFFDARWKSFADYIEVSLQELGPTTRVSQINPSIASLMFQGMIRETLYSKCILQTEKYQDLATEDLVEHMIQLFLNAIAYQPAQ